MGDPEIQGVQRAGLDEGHLHIGLIGLVTAAWKRPDRRVKDGLSSRAVAHALPAELPTFVEVLVPKGLRTWKKG